MRIIAVISFIISKRRHGVNARKRSKSIDRMSPAHQTTGDSPQIKYHQSDQTRNGRKKEKLIGVYEIYLTQNAVLLMQPKARARLRKHK